jgi:hypothetical protein
MSVINIQKAERAGARLVVCLAGPSGSGKTFTALQLAYGLANYNSGKVGLLDTENRRGRLYANILVDGNGEIQPFLVGDMDAPFSPKRYSDAIMEFQAAGVEVLVIDSGSHEWEGTGGCEDIAFAGQAVATKWNVAKREHKAFMNVALQCDMHIIFCIRAREKVDMNARDATGKKIVKSLGVQPICEKNFMFEMTASLLMCDEGTMQDVIKCPSELRGILGRGNDYITSADGKALREWVDGGAKLDPAIEHARNTLRTIAAQGVEAYRKAFEATSAKIKKALVADGTHATLKASAEAFDKQRIDAKPGGADLDSLNDEIDAG